MTLQNNHSKLLHGGNMSFQSRNIEIPLIDNQIIYADSNSTYKLLFLDVPALEGLLPHAEGLWVESLLMNCAVDEIDWNIDAFVGFDREHELQNAQAFFASDVSTIGSQKLDASNLTSAYYRRHARLVVRWKLHSGSTPKQGNLSIVLYVKTVGI